jgi:DNA-binding transcriptional ArsR family regulator
MSRESESTSATAAPPIAVAEAPVVPHELTHPRIEDVDLSAVLAALAEPARLTILRTVAALDGASCAEIWEHTGLGGTKSTMSHHYKVMREAGLVFMWWVGSRKHVTIRRTELDTRWPGLLDAVVLDKGAKG